MSEVCIRCNKNTVPHPQQVCQPCLDEMLEQNKKLLAQRMMLQHATDEEGARGTNPFAWS